MVFIRGSLTRGYGKAVLRETEAPLGNQAKSIGRASKFLGLIDAYVEWGTKNLKAKWDPSEWMNEAHRQPKRRASPSESSAPIRLAGAVSPSESSAPISHARAKKRSLSRSQAPQAPRKIPRPSLSRSPLPELPMYRNPDGSPVRRDFHPRRERARSAPQGEMNWGAPPEAPPRAGAPGPPPARPARRRLAFEGWPLVPRERRFPGAGNPPNYGTCNAYGETTSWWNPPPTSNGRRVTPSNPRVTSERRRLAVCT